MVLQDPAAQSAFEPAPSQVDQHVAIGIAAERSIATRLKDLQLFFWLPQA